MRVSWLMCKIGHPGVIWHSALKGNLRVAQSRAKRHPGVSHPGVRHPMFFYSAIFNFKAKYRVANKPTAIRI